jgi:hypothetical protein
MQATVVQRRPGAAQAPVLWCRHLQEQRRPLFAVQVPVVYTLQQDHHRLLLSRHVQVLLRPCAVVYTTLGVAQAHFYLFRVH